MTNELTPAHLSTARSALEFVRRALAARRENTAALDRTIEAIESALATSASGSPKTPMRDDEGNDDAWVNTTEAARLLGTSERWAREIAPSIGGRKRFGHWEIPRDALPEEET